MMRPVQSRSDLVPNPAARMSGKVESTTVLLFPVKKMLSPDIDRYGG
jgi:hypothetical protein